MPRLTELKFKHNLNNYLLEFDLDDKAIMEDRISVDILARVVNPYGQEFRVALTVEIDYREFLVTVKNGDHILFRRSFHDLRALLPEWDECGPDGPPEDVYFDALDTLGEVVNENIGGVVEEIIAAIPVPDPILGCMLKAGVSATIGQAVTCNQHARREGFRQRIREIAACLIDNAGGIFSRAAWRLSRCIATLGFN